MKQPSSTCRNRALYRVAVMTAAWVMQLSMATAQTACVIPAAPSIAWDACSAPQTAASLNPGQTFTVQNTAAGYIGSLTRICALNGVLAAIAAPCTARASILPSLFPGQSGGDWTLNDVGQAKEMTLTAKSNIGCGLTLNYTGSALVNRDGSITVTVPPHSGFASCTAPRPYLQNPTSCGLTSAGYQPATMTFGPGFVVTSVAAENTRGSGCN